MRICLFSKYGQSSNWLYEGTRKGLEENNIPYLDLNTNAQRNELTPHWTAIPTLQPTGKKTKDTDILDSIRVFAPTHIWLLSYSGLQFLVDNGPELRKILPSHGRIIYWTGDLAKEVQANTTLGQYIDYIFLNDSATLQDFREKWAVKNVHYMPHGTVPASKFPSSKKEIHDLVFLGRRQRDDTRYDERNMVLDGLGESLDFLEASNIVSVTDVHQFYQQSKIAVGVSWNNSAYLYTSDRVFNILGSGCFCLHFYFSGIERLFENGKHLVWFKNMTDGVSLVQYYLRFSDKREEIAYNGYNLVRQKHSYTARVKNIIDIIEEKTNTFYGFLT